MAFAVYLMLFDTPAKGVIDIAVTLAAACLFNAYFAQAVLGVVVVVQGCTDGLFDLGSAVLVVGIFIVYKVSVSYIYSAILLVDYMICYLI
ncbi:hypothetical protein BGI32_02920 [Snodgrassella alvi]|uniref:Uncharacterized protein n=1 Tax=Snodgrassella alvi TaxID=1196083 RepID=A0A2N9WVK4_9NEIS|nr:hypothetical protein [Snodgrassella alvi]PIT17344.1 hypothetical protein BGI32_02920 [Snodgrassella alvi]